MRAGVVWGGTTKPKGKGKNLVPPFKSIAGKSGHAGLFPRKEPVERERRKHRKRMRGEEEREEASLKLNKVL